MMTLFERAQRFVGEIRELPGNQHHPAIQWSHMLCALGSDQPDEVPWCSSWLNLLCWLDRWPRSKSAAARSWLDVGTVVELHRAEPKYDVVIFKRGSGVQPGPHVRKAPGHVGVFAGYDAEKQLVYVIGGNQGNTISIQPFPVDQVLGVRRLVSF